MSDFLGWSEVSNIINHTLENNGRLNDSQKASVKNILMRIESSGVIIADEVGMGKTRIAVELIQAVKEAGGRVAIVIPTTLGFQWQKELNERESDLAPKHTINSLWRYMQAWSDDENSEHLDEEPIVLVSHNFANWRIGELAGNRPRADGHCYLRSMLCGESMRQEDYPIDIILMKT